MNMNLESGVADGRRRVNPSAPASTGRVSPVRDSAKTAPTEAIGVSVTGTYDATLPPEALTLSDELVLALGLRWTRHNPVWSPSALDRMRALQHVLMKRAFALPQAERGPLLDAVQGLELNLALRLRLDTATHAEQQAVLRGPVFMEPAGALHAGRSDMGAHRVVAA